eukprot:g9508.t1
MPVAFSPLVHAQHEKYATGERWKISLNQGTKGWFSRWDAMVQPRIDQLIAAIAASETLTSTRGGEGNPGDNAEPFRVALVGDSTMMMQSGVICAFLAERPGRRFDPAEHNEECCVDTLPRQEVPAEQPGEVEGPAPAFQAGGGRGLCFRDAFQRYADPPEWEALGSPDVVYFGSGLHFLHMCGPGKFLEAKRVQGWLNYERDLEKAVQMYRAGGGNGGVRVVFMASHTVEDSVYGGDFLDVLEAYRANDTDFIDICERQMTDRMVGNATGPEEYGRAAYCRHAMLDRNGSEVLNRRSRPVMERLGVPIVPGDLISKDQAWATPNHDGRHYQQLVPVEVWELFGALVAPDLAGGLGLGER